MKTYKIFKTIYRALNILVILMMTLNAPLSVFAYTYTDKEDYQPGETVIISGDNSDEIGYLPGETVHVDVYGPPDFDVFLTCDAVADENGAWTCSVLLPADETAIGLYYYITYGLTSGVSEMGSFTDGSIGTYDQCSNDDGDGYATGNTGCRWINGNLQRNNSTYYEGDSTIQRAWLTQYEPGSDHTVTFKYGTTKGAKHAYDYLTTWDHSEDWSTVQDRCEGIRGCEAAPETPSDPIPLDPNAMGLDDYDRFFTIRGGTITAVSEPQLVSGVYGTGDTETIVTVSFTVGAADGSMCTTKQGVTTCDVAIWFGAHIAMTSEWMPIDGQTGAGGISGSPYHVALDAVDGASIGQRDNQMQANAVVVIVKSGYKWHDLNADGDKDAGEPPLEGWTFYVDYNNDGVLDPMSEPHALTDAAGYYEITGINVGTWKVREVQQAGWTCSFPLLTDSFGCYYQEDFTATGTYENNDFGNYMASPEIDIDKTGDTLSKVGDDVNYTITVTNTSGPGTPDLYCHVTDPLLSFEDYVTLPTGGYTEIPILGFSIPEGADDPFVNTAYVDCTYVGGSTSVASDSDGHSVNLFQPSVSVTKTGDLMSKVGDDVNYIITVNNTSSTDSPNLVNGTIVDSLLGDLLATNPFVTSSTCGTTLATGASCTINATRTVLATDPDPLPNTVTVHYNPDGFPNDITDSDSHSVDLFQPAINLLKTGDTLSKIGDMVDYVITLENNSSA
ncbi:MAG: hypothetical protein CVU40_05800, partial [Chloroflexi bacterium HGW-Chloroflexi-2]